MTHGLDDLAKRTVSFMIIGFSLDILKTYAQKPKALLSYSLSLYSRLFLRYCVTYLFLHNQVPQNLVA